MFHIIEFLGIVRLMFLKVVKIEATGEYPKMIISPLLEMNQEGIENECSVITLVIQIGKSSPIYISTLYHLPVTSLLIFFLSRPRVPMYSIPCKQMGPEYTPL